MEAEEEEKKKLNDDLVVFLRKRSQTETPRYSARLHAYVDLQRKRSRIAAARRSAQCRDLKSPTKKKDEKDKKMDNNERPLGEERVAKKRGTEKGDLTRPSRPRSRSGSHEPLDRCGRRRRRRRRRSCSRPRRRRRRRRRSCRRRRSRRRRRPRRSCSRRRRRRSCGRKRRRRRRRRSC